MPSAYNVNRPGRISVIAAITCMAFILAIHKSSIGTPVRGSFFSFPCSLVVLCLFYYLPISPCLSDAVFLCCACGSAVYGGRDMSNALHRNGKSCRETHANTNVNEVQKGERGANEKM